MRIVKRILAGFSAISVLFSFNMIRFISIAEETNNTDITQDSSDTEDNFDLIADIPEQWSKDLEDWIITADDDTILYYKTSVSPISEDSWGTYTDNDANAWNSGNDLDDGEGFIKFWAVKEVNGEEKIVNSEAVPYKYDTTPPDSFEIEKVEVENNKFAFQNKELVSDNLSGIEEVWYIINSENIQTVEDIYNAGKVAAFDGKSFEISYTEEMNNSNVTVYLIDKAGNYVSYVYKELPVPALNVSGIDSNQWVNNLDGWNVSIDSPEAKIYFEISDTDLQEWGECSKENVWPDSKEIVQEGNKFIHFWAFFEDQDFECMENTQEYKYDRTAPEKFEVIMSEPFLPQPWNTNWIQRNFKVDIPITDKLSGIKSVVYKIGNSGENSVDFDAEKGTFSIDLDNNAVANQTITFIAEDISGNKRQFILNNKDKVKPVINNVSISLKEVNSDIISWRDKTALSYGSENNNSYVHHTYAKLDDYLKISVTEENLKTIIITVNGESKYFSVESEEAKKDGLEIVFGENIEKKDCYIPLSSLTALKEGNVNSIYVQIVDFAGNQPKTEGNIDIFYDTNVILDSKINITSENFGEWNSEKENNTIDGKRYYGENIDDNISINLSDNGGIKGYTIEISGPDGFENITQTTDISSGETTNGTYKMPYTKTTQTIEFKNDILNADGQYKICVEVEDLAGNTKLEEYDFYVDTSSPEVIDEKYTYTASVLNYLTSGIFGKETMDITIKVKDNGCGINKNDASLYWGGKKFEGKLNEKDGSMEFTFKELPVGKDDIPRIVITDLLGNRANYYFATEDGKLSNIDEKTHLVLEKIPPYAEIILPKDNQYFIKEQIWYPSGFDYNVIARDNNSGLNRVDLIEGTENYDGIFKEKTEEGIMTDGKYTKFVDMAERFTKEAKYQYHIDDEGNYKIIVNAQDNAGNNSSDASDSAMKRIKEVHIDKTDPEIIEFQFNGQNDNGADMERGTYGFYFADDTKVKVFVKDDGNSSGIKYVTLYRRDVNGQEKSVRIYSSDADYHDSEDGVAYAEFTIEKGFKGQVWAIVADNVVSDNPFEDGFKHTSGLRYADGNIIEDAELHKSVSGIIISENIESNKSDSNGIPLYNTSVPLTINVQDTFSGISTIEWSIANDGSSGVITVGNDGSYQSSSGMVSIINDSITRDANLITNLSFNITVSGNTNDNEVYIKFTDRSGNVSEARKRYSIDTTKPTITASLSNQNPVNTMYYNTDQIVTISITERNFDAYDVRFMLNGSEQIIGNWTSTGEGDATVHTGTFTISTDGDYSYTITFTDMAGNTAEPFNQSMFIVDKTAPVLKTNFDEFKTLKEEHYFGRDSINKTAKITIIEHNFSIDGANVEILKKESGLEHNTSAMSAIPAYGWIDNGDEHILEIPFKENDDGIYLIKVSPVDLASNSTAAQETAVFEIDFTNPIIVERNGVYTKDEKQSYENLEIYNEKTGIEENFIPSVAFSDTTFDHIDYDLTVYTPEYSNEKEIGTIAPKTESGNISEKLYSLSEFKKDGVYSVDLTAVDKAGNRSILCRNTSVLMMESDVLAYISNSNKAESKGWYSLQKDENTPISKRPDAFSDLDITVFAQEDSKTSIILRDENGESQNTEITAKNSEDMYAVGVYNYTLPKEYFSDNYPEGTNKDLYLWAENTYGEETSHITLGWIRIDALAPTCSIPDDLKDWKAYTSNTKTITLSNISESLDKSKCAVYDNGTPILQKDFDYSDETDTMSYTLEKGWHDLSFVLADEAGNTYTVQEISSIQVGLFYCLWFRILCGIVVAGAIAGVVIIFVKKKRVVNK